MLKSEHEQLTLFYNQAEKPDVVVGRTGHLVWDQKTDTVIGKAYYIHCAKCGAVLGCHFDYRPDVWYHDRCPFEKNHDKEEANDGV